MPGEFSVGSLFFSILNVATQNDVVDSLRMEYAWDLGPEEDLNRIDPGLVASSPTIENALSILAETSSVVGEKYFPVVVEGLSKALNARWAFVCNFNPATPDKASTIAFWDNGHAENFVYELLNTPCADVASEGVCCFANNITSLYPMDQMLKDIGAKSYAGTALQSLDGRVLGLLAVMDDKPFSDPEIVERIVELFSGRAAAELERLATTSLNERFGKIVEASVSEAYVFDGKTFRFELVNRGARENLGYSMEELRCLTPWDLKPEYSKEEFIEFVQPLLDGDVEVLKFQTVHMRKDASTYPVSVQLQYFSDPNGVFFASITDETERKEREEREKLILNEMNHRTKNVLAVVQVIARQTAKRNPEDYVERLEARIAGLSASHNVLVQNAWTEVPFEDLIRSQLGHFDHLIGSRITLSGPPMKIKATAAQGLGLALHELSTNAAKYGALSNEGGLVDVVWEEIEGEEGTQLRLTWSERQGPEVVKPEKSGFGSFMIEKSLAAQYSCQVDMDYDPSGLKCVFTAPKDSIIST